MELGSLAYQQQLFRQFMKEWQAHNRTRKDVIKRRYRRRKCEMVMGIRVDELPPHTFPKDNILKGFGTFRKEED